MNEFDFDKDDESSLGQSEHRQSAKHSTLAKQLGSSRAFAQALRIPIIARITLGLISVLVTALTLLSTVGFFPNARLETQSQRAQFCESTAMSFSLMAQHADAETMQAYMEDLSQRHQDVVSLAVRRMDGELVVSLGEHEEHWSPSLSSDHQMWIQLFAGQEPWGTFEVIYEPWRRGWLTDFWRPEFAHGTLVSLICLFGFYSYLKLALKRLDPSKVVPNRVREALDTLSEGLLIVDNHERIVLANRAFEAAINESGVNAHLGNTGLVGLPVARLPFVSRDENSKGNPWAKSIETKESVTGYLMELEFENDDDDQQRTFCVNASPIMDELGNSRGVLITFEDVTRLEQKKRELTSMVEFLRHSSEAIKQQNRELEKHATRDPLTDCLNRRSFFDRFDTLWKSAVRYDQPLSACMVDIDFFKSINDDFGHSTGDEVLCKIAESLKTLCRDSDLVCRYGGEEFVILMPMTTSDEAAIATERYRAGIEQLPFEGFSVTASFGLCGRSDDTEDPQTLLELADKCLYVAKRRGRNRVVRRDEVPTDLVIDETKVSRIRTDEPDEVSVPYHAVTALISALAYRDLPTASHSRRVADLCVMTAEGLLSMKDCYTLEIAALLHDIGKVGVPDNILLKPDRLTEEEWKVMRQHDSIGKEIVRASFASPQLTAIIEHYQAHYGDPSARPSSPSGTKIPLAARILAIADAFDAMTSDRVFRKGRTARDACNELRRCAGTQFDPELVERFINAIQTRPAIGEWNPGAISKETALVIGLQIERLAEVLDEQDFDALEAMSQRLQMSADKFGVQAISEKANELQTVLNAERDPHAILQIADQLLELCRSTQQTFLTFQHDDKPEVEKRELALV